MAEGVRVTGVFADVLAGKADLTMLVTGVYADIICGRGSDTTLQVTGVYLDVIGTRAYTDGVVPETTRRVKLAIWD